ncbi:uroporphyrinogen-III C-methyltransferase [Natrialbaceae archaeon A-gly3]
MHTGTVYIVGAGPGDPDLLTFKAHRLLSTCDVVLHDSLVGDGIVDLIPEDVRRVHVGKRAGGERTPQEEINRRLVEEAEAGHTVVRLKGGDPTVFGRGGEEAQYLAANDIPMEVVPGVTSAVGGPGSVGIPLTHRDCSSSLTIVTGHEDPSKPESALDWESLAGNVDAGGTLVVLMGVGRLPDNVAALREHGLEPETPVAMVERATLSEEEVVTGTLADIVETARTEGIEPPALTVVGEVVEVRETVKACLGGASETVWQQETTAEDELEVNQEI